jgi:peptidoglycan/xylan/chitin deacetylase (PgdA/CDA1 family)
MLIRGDRARKPLGGPPGQLLLEGASRRRRRYRRRRLTAAALLVLLVTGLAFGLSRGAGAPPRLAQVSLGPVLVPRHGAGRALPVRSVSAQAAAQALDAALSRTAAQMPFVRIAGAQHRELALTFDDGPGPYTPQILSELERLHVPATFFEVGMMERWFHASTSRIVRDGDVIGDHTEIHPDLAWLSPAGQRLQLLEQAAAVGRWGAPFPRLFRPPYGRWNATTLGLLHRLHMLMVLWSVDTSDYLRPGVRAIVDSALRGARPGAIILLHDAGGERSQTVRALPQIVAALRRRGYRLVTVPQLLLDNPAPRPQPAGALGGGD